MGQKKSEQKGTWLDRPRWRPHNLSAPVGPSIIRINEPHLGTITVCAAHRTWRGLRSSGGADFRTLRPLLEASDGAALTRPGGELKPGARVSGLPGDSATTPCDSAVRRSGGSGPGTPLVGGEDSLPGAAGETGLAGPSGTRECSVVPRVAVRTERTPGSDRPHGRRWAWRPQNWP
ncbi:hypothetical protein NDU88_009370 [Pleurodeles waltl]|uniref:Uncharacterized protein n=1 Tax=Pleurodeles waltl TaxID=8319 RepID=A0AAV7PUT7_PLEWA|nr:hypothetical protein NDU88_009370 [Pleurodeles waltl]